MTLSSMTGFARSHGASGPYSFAWEIKSVNAKGLDLRLRLPPGWDAIEQPVRAKAAEALARGTVYANLAVERPTVQPIVRINDQVLAAVLATLDGLSGRVQAELPRLDGILAIKGVVEVVEADEDVRDYVERLERDEDDGREDDGDRLEGSGLDGSGHGPIDEASLPSGDALAAELERFLREQRGE